MSAQAPSLQPISAWAAYRLRWKRRGLLWRSFRSRHQLDTVVDRTDRIGTSDILAIVVLRNERLRLPFFLAHYRALGVGQFLVVDNGSDDGSQDLLAEQADVSLWRTEHSYRAARFGLDWVTWLKTRYGHGHWCLMADVDEILVYAEHETQDLHHLTGALEARDRRAFGALMLDLYPKDRLGRQSYAPGQDPVEVVDWFDDGPYRAARQDPLGNLWVQGGARERMFFQQEPRRSPTLNKLPLIRWDRRYACVNSCHSALPRSLNDAYSGPGGRDPSGVLLHSKFLPDILARSAEEKQRAEHFHAPQNFDDYYDRLMSEPVLWHEGSVRYDGWRQLCDIGLMSGADWQP